jgi:tetratricopeptide (TPR) repeat protein
MSRWILALLLALAAPLHGQVLKKQRPQPPTKNQEEVPPEEDKSLSVKEYSFNPLQAEKEVRIGNYYFRTGSYRAAAGRFLEAIKWNSGYDEAWLRLGDAEVKLKDSKAAKEAYAKYLELAPDAKNAAEIRKKLAKLK